MHLPRKLAAAALALPLSVAVTGADPAASATAAEVSYPVGGVFALTGHGYGHGHGLSQWGAYGAALRGLTSSQVLDFYYPGTTAADGGNPLLRVQLSRDEGTDVVVVPSARTGALGVVDHGNGDRNMPLPGAVGAAPVSAWRTVVAGPGTVRLEGLWSGAWQAFPVGAPWVSAGRVEFVSALARLTVAFPGGGQQDYHGSVVSVPVSASRVETVNIVAREDYLRGVVPSESPASWPGAALEAQAVAARTYAASVSTPTGLHDLCDTSACQVYAGIASYSASGALVATHEVSTTDAAIARTAGLLRFYGGRPIFAQFSSADGGWTLAGSPSTPYLVSQADPYDGVVPNNANTWTQTVSAAQLGSATGTGTALSLRVDGRDGRGDWGGRTTAVTVTGTAGTRSLSADALRIALGLKSTWWVTPAGSPPRAPVPRDLYDVVLQGTGTGSVEVHGLSAASGYRTFLSHAGSAFGPADPADWRFFVAPYGGSGGPDLWGVHLRGTGSGRVEVHVVSASSGYRTFVAHVATAQPALPAGGVDVALSSFGGDGQPDLFLVPWTGTGSGQVEVHVLAAATGWMTFLEHAASALPTAQVAGGKWRFLVGDRAGSGDLVGVLHAGPTGSGRTEVHVLARVGDYRTWTAHVATPAAPTDDATSSWELGDADGDGVPDVVLLLGGVTGTGSTEVHALGGAAGYGAWTVHTGTALAAGNPAAADLSFGG